MRVGASIDSVAPRMISQYAKQTPAFAPAHSGLSCCALLGLFGERASCARRVVLCVLVDVAQGALSPANVALWWAARHWSMWQMSPCSLALTEKDPWWEDQTRVRVSASWGTRLSAMSSGISGAPSRRTRVSGCSLKANCLTGVAAEERGCSERAVHCAAL